MEKCHKSCVFLKKEQPEEFNSPVFVKITFGNRKKNKLYGSFLTAPPKA